MRQSKSRQGGVSLVEVLVAMVILAIGLMSLVGLQGKITLLQAESYQRAQALILLHDMANRIVLNRNDANAYITASPLGTGMTCPTTTATRQELDTGEWCTSLQGAAELQGTSRVGAMVGARGCVESLATGDYLVTVAWQGMGPVSAPPAGVTCGANLYDGAVGTACVADLCRRVVTTIVRLAVLT